MRTFTVRADGSANCLIVDDGIYVEKQDSKRYGLNLGYYIKNNNQTCTPQIVECMKFLDEECNIQESIGEDAVLYNITLIPGNSKTPFKIAPVGDQDNECMGYEPQAFIYLHEKDHAKMTQWQDLISLRNTHIQLSGRVLDRSRYYQQLSTPIAHPCVIQIVAGKTYRIKTWNAENKCWYVYPFTYDGYEIQTEKGNRLTYAS